MSGVLKLYRRKLYRSGHQRPFGRSGQPGLPLDRATIAEPFSQRAGGAGGGVVDAGDQFPLGGGGPVQNVVDGVMKALVVLDMVDIFNAAGGKVVEHIDLVTAFEKSFGEVGADETRASRNEELHNQRPPFAGPLLPAFLITS